jgi:hypothetical protein
MNLMAEATRCLKLSETASRHRMQIQRAVLFPTWFGVGDLDCRRGYTSGVDPYSQISHV